MEPLNSSPLAHLKPVIEADSIFYFHTLHTTAVHACTISTNGEGERVVVLKERNYRICWNLLYTSIQPLTSKVFQGETSSCKALAKKFIDLYTQHITHSAFRYSIIKFMPLVSQIKLIMIYWWWLGYIWVCVKPSVSHTDAKGSEIDILE